MSVLSDEITNDPLTRGYAGMTDQQVADDLNTAYREVDKPVDLRGLIVYLLKNGKWLGIEAEAGSNALGVQSESRAFMVVMNNPNFEDLDLSDPVVQAMLLNIKNAGLLDNADQTAILAMGKETITRAQELGLGAVKPGYVWEARR